MERKFPFTKTAIEGLSLPILGKRICYYDTKVPGLELRITSTGVRTFNLLRKIEGRTERVRIGGFPAVTVENARRRASEINGSIAQGENPAQSKRTLKSESSLRETFDSFIKLHAKGHKKTWQGDVWQFEKYLSSLGNRKLSSIRPADVKTLHAHLGTEHGVYTANRVFALLSSIFNFARRMGFTGENPCSGIQKFREEKRDRFIQESELPRFFEAVMSESDTTARDCILMMLLSGQRRACALSMRWDEIDFDRAEWRIPAEKMKSGEIHRVPLVGEAIRILRDRSAKSESEWVFPSERRENHIREPKGPWTLILENAGISDLRFHDLRRTLASYMAITGASLLTIAQMLGHKVASSSVTGIYARLSLEPVRQAMETAVRAMLVHRGIIPQSEVIPFQERKNIAI